MPPLLIHETDVDEAIELLEASLEEELASGHREARRGVASH
jgi:hypothetical protein